MFSQACVIPSVHRRGGSAQGRAVCPEAGLPRKCAGGCIQGGGGQTPSQSDTMGYGQRAGGTLLLECILVEETKIKFGCYLATMHCRQEMHVYYC